MFAWIPADERYRQQSWRRTRLCSSSWRRLSYRYETDLVQATVVLPAMVKLGRARPGPRCLGGAATFRPAVIKRSRECTNIPLLNLGKRKAHGPREPRWDWDSGRFKSPARSASHRRALNREATVASGTLGCAASRDVRRDFRRRPALTSAQADTPAGRALLVCGPWPAESCATRLRQWCSMSGIHGPSTVIPHMGEAPESNPVDD